MYLTKMPVEIDGGFSGWCCAVLSGTSGEG